MLPSFYIGRFETVAKARKTFHVFQKTNKRERPTSFPRRSQVYPGHMMQKVDTRPLCKASGSTWADSFVFAGGSALLLLLVNLFPEFWYFSFFALTPLLYRLIKATPGESLRLGFLFGVSYFSISVLHSVIVSPVPALVKLACGTTLFALFGWAVGLARHRWGFNPAFVALLWVGLEMGLLKLQFVNGLLGSVEPSHSFLGGLIALFGFLAAAAIIAFLNSLLVLAIVKILTIRNPRGKSAKEDQRFWGFFFAPGVSSQKVYLVPEGRAPPPPAII